MAKEKHMRRWVIKYLKKLDAIAVENPVYPGTPDVNYIEGWIELKSLDKFPKRLETTKIKISHFTKQQRAWLLKRHLKGGAAFLFLQVAGEFFLFDGRFAAKNIGEMVYEDLKKNALKHWTSKPTKDEFLKCFQKT